MTVTPDKKCAIDTVEDEPGLINQITLIEPETPPVTTGRIVLRNDRRRCGKRVLHVGIDGFVVLLKLPVSGHPYAVRCGLRGQPIIGHIIG